MKRLQGILLAVYLLLGACSAEDDAPGGMREGDCPIGFSSTVEETPTRGNDLTTGNILSMGVFAYYTGDKDWTTAHTPNFMYNQPVTRSANSAPWTYTPVRYWPNNDTDKLSFVAYAPYVNEAVAGGSNPSFSGRTTAGYPVLNYAVPAKEADQLDLLAAAPLKNRYYSEATGNSIKLDMQHALTKVTFKVKSGDKYPKTVSALSVKTAAKGELHFKDGGFEWQNMNGTNTYTPATATLNLAATDSEKDAASFFFLPTSAVSATFSVTYTVSAADGTVIKNETITDKALPTTLLWEAGASISYTINLSESEVTVTVDASNSGSWASAGSEEKTVKFYTADELKVGDYYYSDGTTSDGGLRRSATTNDAASGGQNTNMLITDKYEYESVSPTAGKTCIGIVFYVGEGSGDNVADYSDVSITRIDGYVVALRDAANNIKWGPTGGGEGLTNANPVTDTNFNGYANTKKVKALTNISSYSAFTSAVNYGSGVAHPSTASGWYLPSIAQLRSIYSSNGASGGQAAYPAKIVALNLKMCNGGVAFQGERYWSSTPYNNSVALYMGFNFGDLYLDATKTNSNIYHVRSILTFQRVTN